MTSTAPLPVHRPAAGVSRDTERYVIDTSRSFVQVRVRHVGVSFGGRLDISGTIRMPDDLRSASVDAAIAPDSFRPSGGRARRRLAADLATAIQAPLTFTADGMEPILESFVTHDGDRPLWALVGHLTVDGVTRPLRIAVGLMHSTDDGAGLKFSGTATVRCADLGIGRTGLSEVVRVRVEGVAHRDRM